MSVFQVSLCNFVISIVCGQLPTTLIFTFIGVKIKSVLDFVKGEEKLTPFEWVIIVLGVLAFLSAVFVLFKKSRDNLLAIIEPPEPITPSSSSS